MIREPEHATGFLDGCRARPMGLLRGRIRARHRHPGRVGRPGAPWGPAAAEHLRGARGLVADTLELAGDYRDAGCGAFATLPENAASNLYTFVLHPRMEPTNNSAERGLRASVIARKVHQGLRTPAGLRTFGILMARIMT